MAFLDLLVVFIITAIVPACKKRRFISVAQKCPELVAEWDIEANGSTAWEVSAGSNEKARWICPNKCEDCGEQHPKYDSMIIKRTNPEISRGCPVCANQKLCQNKCRSLATLHPDIAAQLHPTKNGNLSASDVFARSDKKVCWICPMPCDDCGELHDFWATIGSKTSKVPSGCPICSSPPRQHCHNKCKSLAKRNPQIALQLHPENKKTAYEIFARSGINAKWICPNRCDICNEQHPDYRCRVACRTGKGAGCPVCANPPKQMCRNKCTSLAKMRPDIAMQLHKDTTTKSDEIMCGSQKEYLWVCEQKCSECGLQHPPYPAQVYNRANLKNPTGCPLCSRTSEEMCANKCESLAKKFPDIAAQWDFLRNPVTPLQVKYGSGKKVWWKCESTSTECGCRHGSYEAIVYNRTKGMNRSGCPVCAHQKLCDNGCFSLAKQNPSLASEWHPTKNGDSTPENTFARSSKKRWWYKECKPDVFHEWPAVVSSRTKLKCGCPLCNESKGEEAVRDALYALGVAFLPQMSLLAYRNQALKFDFGLLPDPSAYLEYDGYYHFNIHHSYKNSVKAGIKHLEAAVARDNEKDKWIIDHGYTLLRIHFDDFNDIDSIVRDYVTNLDSYRGTVVRSPNYVNCDLEEINERLGVTGIED